MDSFSCLRNSPDKAFIISSTRNWQDKFYTSLQKNHIYRNILWKANVPTSNQKETKMCTYQARRMEFLPACLTRDFWNLVIRSMKYGKANVTFFNTFESFIQVPFPQFYAIRYRPVLHQKNKWRKNISQLTKERESKYYLFFYCIANGCISKMDHLVTFS